MIASVLIHPLAAAIHFFLFCNFTKLGSSKWSQVWKLLTAGLQIKKRKEKVHFLNKNNQRIVGLGFLDCFSHSQPQLSCSSVTRSQLVRTHHHLEERNGSEEVHSSGMWFNGEFWFCMFSRTKKNCRSHFLPFLPFLHFLFTLLLLFESDSILFFFLLEDLNSSRFRHEHNYF